MVLKLAMLDTQKSGVIFELKPEIKFIQLLQIKRRLPEKDSEV